MTHTDSTFTMLESGIYNALETYSNVHRGSGHYSVVTTRLYEKARKAVLEYLGLNSRSHSVVFCSSGDAEIVKRQFSPGRFTELSGKDTGLPLGIHALAARKKDFPEQAPERPGGGTARLIGPGWVVWSRNPGRLETGTPAIINVIAFAIALQMTRRFGKDCFRAGAGPSLSAADILDPDIPGGKPGEDILEYLRKTMIGRETVVPTRHGPRPFTNLDSSASTPAFAAAWESFRLTLHQPEPVRKEIVRQVRSIVSGFLGAPATSYDVLFTYNTSESINLVAESLREETSPGAEPVIVTTLLEHSSNDLPWRQVPRHAVVRLPVDEQGFLSHTELGECLRSYNSEKRFGNKRITLVAVSGASNVLGTFNDLEEISRIVHQYDARLLVDAAQLAAHRPIRMEACGIDYLALSAHKIYAPFGTGVLAARKGLLHLNHPEPDRIRAAGDENAAGIAAFGRSLMLLQKVGMERISEKEKALTRRALDGMSTIPGLTVYGIKDPDSPAFDRKGGVIAFAMKGLMAPGLAKELAERGGIGIRSGCHCAHLLVKHILGVGPKLARFQRIIVSVLPGISLPGVARVSIGLQTTEEDIDHLIRTLNEIASGKEKGPGICSEMNDFVARRENMVFPA